MHLGPPARRCLSSQKPFHRDLLEPRCGTCSKPIHEDCQAEPEICRLLRYIPYIYIPYIYTISILWSKFIWINFKSYLCMWRHSHAVAHRAAAPPSAKNRFHWVWCHAKGRSSSIWGSHQTMKRSTWDGAGHDLWLTCPLVTSLYPLVNKHKYGKSPFLIG